jgi:hypothetical protein
MVPFKTSDADAPGSMIADALAPEIAMFPEIVAV